MNTYFCISCGVLHNEQETKTETIFKSGFRYLESTLYAAGICAAEASAQQPPCHEHAALRLQSA